MLAGEALRKVSDSGVTERHSDTDHSYSGEHLELTDAILAWTGENLTR